MECQILFSREIEKIKRKEKKRKKFSMSSAENFSQIAKC